MTKRIVEPIGVLGVGVEGRATIAYLLRHGFTRITALDRSAVSGLPETVASVVGPDHDHGLERFATLFRSPGIRPDHPSLVSARRAGAHVTSAVSYFLERSPAPVIGITGTLGKGTAASLTASALEAAGFTTHLGGNIGRSPLEFLDEVAPDHRVVLEISSFQAMDIAASPGIGVVLKTTSEHLDWHTGLDEYLEAKSHLFCHQTPEDTVVSNADSPGAMMVAEASRGRQLHYSREHPVANGVHFNGEIFTYYQDGIGAELPLRRPDIRLAGAFNLENIAAALTAAVAAGAALDPICRDAAAFEGLPHRLEFVTEARGVRFYNDSYATRPEATIGAVSCFEDIPLALILGGSEKHADFHDLVRELLRHPTLAHISLIGATANRLLREVEQGGTPAFSVALNADLPSAVSAAHRAVQGGGVVLLSPACASFGLFPNYKVRGERFREIVTAAANAT